MVEQPPKESVPNPLWEPCPPGEFNRLSRKLSARRQRRTFLQATAATATSLAVLGGSAWLFFQSSGAGKLQPGGLTCGECAELLPAYQKQQLQQELHIRVQEHLAACFLCRRKYRSLTANPETGA